MGKSTKTNKVHARRNPKEARRVARPVESRALRARHEEEDTPIQASSDEERDRDRLERQRPEGADEDAWLSFCEMAEEQGIGEHPDDWSIYWDFFQAGIDAVS